MKLDAFFILKTIPERASNLLNRHLKLTLSSVSQHKIVRFQRF